MRLCRSGTSSENPAIILPLRTIWARYIDHRYLHIEVVFVLLGPQAYFGGRQINVCFGDVIQTHEIGMP
jgi:hypothetical protein